MASSKKQPPAKKTKPAAIKGRGAKPTPRGAVRPRAEPKATPKQPARKRAGATAAPPPAAPAPEPKKPGRPSIHSAKVAAQFCEYLMGGKTLREACAQEGMPGVTTIMRWLHDDVGGFRAQYARAREVQAELDVDDQVAIADHPQRYAVVAEHKDAQGNKVPVLVALDPAEVANRRLQADARRWRASKMAPKKYGSLLDTGGEGGLALVLVNDMTGRKAQPPEAGQEGGA